MRKGAQFRLVEDLSQLCLLEVALLKFFPDSLQMLNSTRLFIQKKFPQNMDIQLYMFEDPEDFSNNFDEPFLVCIQRPNVHSPYGVISWTALEPTRKMIKAYDNLINWDKVHLFSNNRPSFCQHLKCLNDKHGNKSTGLPGVILYLDIKKALEFEYSNGNPDPNPNSSANDPKDCFKPPKIEVKQLEEHHAALLVKNWKFAEPHSQAAIVSCIKSLTSMGLFVDGELASSAILSPLGLINIVYTEERFRRKGYGEITMLALSKEVAKLGLVPAAEAESCNHKSIGLMEKCGFEKVSDVIWLYFEK